MREEDTSVVTPSGQSRHDLIKIDQMLTLSQVQLYQQTDESSSFYTRSVLDDSKSFEASDARTQLQRLSASQLQTNSRLLLVESQSQRDSKCSQCQRKMSYLEAKFALLSESQESVLCLACQDQVLQTNSRHSTETKEPLWKRFLAQDCSLSDEMPSSLKQSQAAHTHSLQPMSSLHS